jgi:5-methylcytosine-specific restriction enzyme A
MSPLAPKKPCRAVMCPHLSPCPVHGDNKQQSQRQYDAQRSKEPWRKWYWSSWWRAMSRAFLQEHPLCEDIYNLHHGFPTPATVTDHRIPHCGNRELFEDWNNLSALCAVCHGRKTREGL